MEQEFVDAHESELIMLIDGDKRIRWRRGADSENEARKAFIEKIDAGWSAFRLDGKEDEGEQITKFDSHAKKILLVPPLVGG